MRVIISGATSMIGLALTKEFIENGHTVYAIVRPNSGKENLLPISSNLHLIYANLDEYGSLQPISDGADIFYHFAWAGTDKQSRQSLSIQKENVQYATDAMDYAIKCGCKKFIGAGSQAEYGKQNQVITESTITTPDTPYGIAKLVAGFRCLMQAKDANIDCIWGRIFSVYGPHDSKDTLISSSIDKVLKGEKLWLSSCEQYWNYLYESDIAVIFYKLGIDRVASGIYNIANDKSIPLKEYIHSMTEVFLKENIAVPDLFFDTGILPTAHLNADTHKLYTAINYKPETSFEDGIKTILQAKRG